MAEQSNNKEYIEEDEQGTKKRKVYDVPYTCKLKYPVQWGKDDTVSEIVFPRRLKAKDFRGLPASDLKFDHMIKIVARVTATATTLLEELDAEDFMQLTEVVESFLPAGQKIGDQS